MHTITVTPRDERTFLVSVQDAHSTSTHIVTVWPSDMERYASRTTSVEDLLRASFDFLLAREPKEAILSRFELPIIERYFPDYRAAMRALFSTF